MMTSRELVAENHSVWKTNLSCKITEPFFVRNAYTHILKIDLNWMLAEERNFGKETSRRLFCAAYIDHNTVQSKHWNDVCGKLDTEVQWLECDIYICGV